MPSKRKSASTTVQELHQAIQKVEEIFERLKTEVSEKEEHLEVMRTELEGLEVKINKSSIISISDDTQRIVKLNIGGTTFTTTLETLTSENPTFFSILFR